MVLREPAARAQLKAGLSSPIPAIRRGSYVTMLLAENLTDEWLRWGLDTTDPWIRLHVAQAIRTLPSDRDARVFIDQMTSCSLRPIRQIAVEMLAEQGDADAVERLRGFLLDQSPTLREFARFYLAKILGHFDAKGFYRDGLATRSKTSRYIAGIGETGDGTDVPKIMPFIKHERSSIRLATIRALARLAPETLTDPFLTALADSSGRIRQVATAALSARRSPALLRQIQTWATTANSAGRRSIVLLLANYRITDHLPALLPLLTDPDEDVRALAENLCLRSLKIIINPFLKPDPWQAWVEEHVLAWSPGHQQRVKDLLQAKARRG